MERLTLLALVFLALFSGSAEAGLFRKSTEPAVYWSVGNRYCWVNSEDQMTAYGFSFSQVAVLSPAEFATVTAPLSYTGACWWPANKCYKGQNELAVYRVLGRNACWVSNESELGRQCGGTYQVIARNDLVLSVHANTGACP